MSEGDENFVWSTVPKKGWPVKTVKKGRGTGKTAFGRVWDGPQRNNKKKKEMGKRKVKKKFSMRQGKNGDC